MTVTKGKVQTEKQFYKICNSLVKSPTSASAMAVGNTDIRLKEKWKEKTAKTGLLGFPFSFQIYIHFLLIVFNFFCFKGFSLFG